MTAMKKRVLNAQNPSIEDVPCYSVVDTVPSSLSTNEMVLFAFIYVIFVSV